MNMTYEKFWAGVHDNPYDWDARLRFADWLEERGLLVLAAGQRWQAENQKAAEYAQPYEFPYTWYPGNDLMPYIYLPPALVKALDGHVFGPSAKEYKTRQRSEESLAKALVQERMVTV